MSEIYCDGEFYPADEAGLTFTDRGFLLGDGVFETLRWQGGEARHWPDHQARMRRGLALMGLDAPDWTACQGALPRLAEALKGQTGVLRLSVTRASLGRGLSVEPFSDSRVVMQMAPLARMQAPHLIWVKDVCRNSASAFSQFKSTSYGEMIAARHLARQGGGTMALIGSPQGHIASADCANVFWITDERIYTPALSTGAMPGTMRARVMAALQQAGLEIEEGTFAPAVLDQASAILLTNALIGMMAAQSYHGRALDQICPLRDQILALTCAL
ncbi:aminotransferase class IV [Woodsholea maritima]|uniref:aminotransferase class IV n=1 Tax=Woodsholea maritima TaxID=240237 RepID=UPI00036ACB19|nr:aminotransferase class IV [Woodsholea maritima]